MKSIVIGSAGHIDHGKTALVKALTGIDADRLEEEKRRGITIDLGFAHLELPAPGSEILRLGFVDVPGHERFVRNMLAGVGGIDVVVLVIAANDSIKPQTREHLDICRLLQVRRGITVLTKSDLVDRETLDVVRLEVEEFLRGSFLEKSPMVAVSSLTGAGLPELRQALAKVALDAPSRDSSAPARLPIDRVFSIKGFGTVVTGTLVSGTIREEEELEILPSGERVRVRNVQVHGQSTGLAVAGQRTALNLAGVAKEELRRGMTLAAPATFRAVTRADAVLSLLPFAKPLQLHARVHLHAYAAETVATVVAYDKKQISPREQAFVQLRFADSISLSPGDRFVIRQLSPVVTIGGGEILDVAELSHRIAKTESLQFLKAVHGGTPEAGLLARVVRRGVAGLAISEAVLETGSTRGRIEETAKPLLAQGRMLRAASGFVSAEAFRAACGQAVAAVTSFQESNPLVAGISREELREQLGVSAEILNAVIEQLAQTGQIVASGDQVHLPGRTVRMKDDETESKALIEAAFVSAGLKVPALKEVLSGLPVDRTRAQKIVTLLLRDKTLIKVSDELVFHREALEDLRKRLGTEKSKSPKMDVSRFKDLTGVTRKYAIPLLEYLDREHVTRRVGNERQIL